MTDAILDVVNGLLIGATVGALAGLFGGWLFHRQHRDPPPDPMEYQEPRVFTRIFDGTNINKEQ